MKKFILLLFLSSCAITFAQNKEGLTITQKRELRARENSIKDLSVLSQKSRDSFLVAKATRVLGQFVSNASNYTISGIEKYTLKKACLCI